MSRHPLSGRRADAHHHAARRLRDLLRADIMRGAFDDTQLPSEADLMRAYDFPRSVVREALALLREAGLIDRLQGYGTYALPAPVTDTVDATYALDGADRPARFWSPVTHQTLIARERVRTPDSVRHLMPDAGDEVLSVDYLTHYHSDVVGVATNYFPYPQAEGLETAQLGTNFYDFLRDGGLQVGEDELWIGATTVDRNLAVTFDLPPGRPLLTMQQRIRDVNGVAIDIAFITLRADRLMLHSRNTRWTEAPFER